MNHITLAFLAACSLAAVPARADHVTFQGSVNFGTPGYVAPNPGYYAPGYYAPSGYWRDVPVNVWVPPHWEVRTNVFGQSYNEYEPGQYVTRVQRVWVNGEANPGWREHEWREHEGREHEWREQQERREHEGDRDRWGR